MHPPSFHSGMVGDVSYAHGASPIAYGTKKAGPHEGACQSIYTQKMLSLWYQSMSCSSSADHD